MKLIYLFFILILIECTAADVRPLGIIEGKVSIGPLCGYAVDPNSDNPCRLTNEELDRIYAEYTVILSSENNTTPLRKILDRTGVFLFEVEEGSYKVYLESAVQNALAFSVKTSIEKTVKVSSQQRVFVELNVNTGRP
jgi:hypothetical protein